MIKEHDIVVLTTPLTDEGLETGDEGTVVQVHQGGQAYEVEFVALDDHTAAVVILGASQVRPANPDDIT